MKKQILRLAVVGTAAVVMASMTPARARGLDDLGGILDQVLGGGKSSSGSFGLAERILESELPRRVGPAKRYDVRIADRGTDLLRGRLGHVDATGIEVRTADGLVIPRMDLALDDVQLGFGSRSLENVAKGGFSLGLGEEVVSNFIRKRAGVGVRDVSVRFSGGQIRVKGTPEVMGMGLRSEVAGKPELTRAGDAIDFRASSVSVLGLKLPRFALDTLEDKINPVLDLSGLNLPVRITDFRVKGDRLAASGALNFSRATHQRNRRSSER